MKAPGRPKKFAQVEEGDEEIYQIRGYKPYTVAPA